MNCLDCEKDLPAALGSLKAQTFQDFEIIFLDNASADQSSAIAKAFGPRLRHFRNEETVPLGAARNQAIAKARGEYVAFLDCDDLWLPEKLERQLALFRQNPRLGLVTTDTEIFNGKRILSRVFDAARPARGMVFEELIERQWISMSSAMLRREALDSVRDGEGGGGWFDERLSLCEEADLFYRVAHDWELDYVPKALTRWRVHGRNTTFTKFESFAGETLLILEKHKRLYPCYENEFPRLARLLRARAAFQSALALWKAGRSGEAREAVREYRKEGRKFRLFWLASFLPGSFFNILSRMYFALPPSLRGPG